MKKLFKTLFFITLALVLLFVVLVIASIVFSESNHPESIGIIGGADDPTAILITRTLIFDSPMFSLLCIVAVLFVASAVGWLIARKK